MHGVWFYWLICLWCISLLVLQIGVAKMKNTTTIQKNLKNNCPNKKHIHKIRERNKRMLNYLDKQIEENHKMLNKIRGK